MVSEATELSLSGNRALEIEPITFICWRWAPPFGYRSKFDPRTISVLHSMLARHYHAPFELVCVTDEPAKVPKQARAVQLWEDFKNVPSPHGRGYPSCYRRLKIFSKHAETFIHTPRFCSIDLDVVITANITPLFSDPAVQFRMYGDTARGTPYNGSMIYARTGARPQLWDKFDPLRAPQLSRAKGYIGSDQGWIGVCLGPNEPKFTAKDGVYSFRNELKPRHGVLPADARIIVFHGHLDPWQADVQLRYKWVRDHYR